MKWSLISGRIWIALTTLLVVALLFAYYFLSYIPARESQLLSKKYRALQRIAKNFSEMRSNYENSIALAIRSQRENRSTPDKVAAPLKNVNGQKTSSAGANTTKAAEHRKLMYKQMLAELSKIHVEVDSTPVIGASGRVKQKKYLYFNDTLRVKIANLITNEDIIDNHFDRFLIIRLFKAAPDTVLAAVAYQGRKFEETEASENKILIGDVNNLFDSAQTFRTIPAHSVRISGTPFRALSYVLEMGTDDDWVLCGLVDEDRIQANVRKIDLFTLIIVVLIALFILLSMPVLKLLVMSSIERLQILNVWFIGFSIVTGTALTIILLLVSHHYVSYQEGYQCKLKKLSDSVTTSFREEINLVLKQMNGLNQDNLNCLNLLPQYEYVLDTSSNFPVKERLLYTYFNELLFLNDSGKVPVTFATHSLPTEVTKLPDLSRRKYFSEAYAGNLESFPEAAAKFYVQSIRSWNSGMHEAGISIPTTLTLNPGGPKNPTDIAQGVRQSQVVVLATATRLRSVMNPILPPGFQFCIVGADGEVLFHSDSKKNLQENFFDEIDHDHLTQAATKGRMVGHLKVDYAGTKCLAYISPLDTHSMFLITLFDRDYHHTPLVLTVGFAFALTIGMMVILGALLLFLFCLTYRTSNLRIRRFSLGWVRPRSNTKAEDFATRYAQCITAMLMIAFLLGSISLWGFARYLTVVFLTLPVLLLALNYAALYIADAENNTARHRNTLVIVSAVVLIAFTAAALWQVKFIAHLWLVVVQSALVLIAVFNVRSNFFTSIHNWLSDKLSIGSLYTTFLCVWLFLVSILPVFYFYKTAFEHENFLWKKFIQLEAFEHHNDRLASLQKEFDAMGFVKPSAEGTRDSLIQNYVSVANDYGNYLACDIDAVDTADVDIVSDGIVERMEFQLRPAFIGPLEKSRRVIINGERPVRWFTRVSREYIFLKQDKEIFYASLLPPFSLLKGDFALPFAIISLLLLFFLYLLIRTCIRYIFGWGLLTGSAVSGTAFRDRNIDELISTGSHKLFIIGLPYSGKSTMLKHLHATRRVKEIFLRNDLDRDFDFSSQDVFIVHHFEHALNDQVLNERRLALFLQLLRLPSAQIIVTSTVQPEAILDVLEGRIKQLVKEMHTEQKDKIAFQKEIATLRNAYRVWKNILSGFEIQYMPLAGVASGTFLEQELQVGTFLPRLKKYYQDTDDIAEREEIVLMIEAQANGYYHSLWNSFIRIEKHALFDLAKDRFLNLRDAGKLRILINKGVIVMKDCPEIMNRSFNDFILSAVKEDEAMAMTNELRRKGSWSGIQLILVIMLVSVTIFIAFAQQEILSSVNALVATISGVVALLLRFSGVFGATKPKE